MKINFFKNHQNCLKTKKVLYNKYSVYTFYSMNYSSCFHIYKNLLALQSPTVSICKTRRFILYLCTLKNNPLLCSYLIRQINVFRLLRIHYFYYFVCPTTLQNIKNIFIGIFYHKFCLCFLQYSHSSNDKSESRGIHKIEL